MIKLKKLCTLITKGTSPSTYGYNFEKNGIKFIRSENLSDSRLLTNVNLFISKEANNVLKRSIINENDVLMSIAGAYLGKLAFVTKKDIPSNTNQAVAIIRIDAKNALPMYIYYYLSSDKINKYINNINSQSAQPNINLKQVGNIPIKLHSIDEQQHIVDIIVHLIYSLSFYLNFHFLVAIFLIHLKLLLFFPLFLLASYRWNHQYQHIYLKLKNNHCL